MFSHLSGLFTTKPKCETPEELIVAIKSAKTDDEIRRLLKGIDNVRLLNVTHFRRWDSAALYLDSGEELAKKLETHADLDPLILCKLLKQAYDLKTQSPPAALIPEAFIITPRNVAPKNFASHPEAWKIFLTYVDEVFMPSHAEMLRTNADYDRYENLLQERACEIYLLSRQKFHT